MSRHLSISVEKSEWGMSRLDYLGHKVTERSLQAKSKNLDALTTLEFPRTLKGLQSFLGSLNYYHRFIADFTVYATSSYALTERDFEEHVAKPEVRDQEKWVHARRAFEVKSKFAETPMLKHFDPERESVVIVYASDWAISGVLTQEHDGVCMPVKFTSRTLKPNELNYDIVEKEILALLRVLNDCYTMLAGRSVRVLTRHTTLAWLFRSKGLTGRLAQWAATLSPWKLEICRSTRGEEEILSALAVSITPRAYVDATLEEIAPLKRPSKATIIPVPIVGPDEEVHVLSFDGSAKPKQEGGAFSAILWKLPDWEIVHAASGYAVDLTVNEAEYRGLLLGFSLLDNADLARLIIIGDSNLAIRQMRDEMDCNSPSLKLLRQRARNELRKWPRHELYHVRRDWNASADLLAGKALQRQGGRNTHSDEELQDLRTLNRLGETIRPRSPDLPEDGRESPDLADSGRETPRVLPVMTRSAAARATPTRNQAPEVLQELVVQRLRLDRIRVAQDEELWITPSRNI
ncbi:unnamed protein product [Phytophthora lilii]|uniref:Unnamed protein product n=1 Tax=Phytophthora lilii TaxID=2077276 RepID=A0A9W6U9B1_9STRA|nr:unnamed protein product [Phytophthora lilii]